MLAPVMIAGSGVAVVVVVALTWIVRRARANDDRLGTISTQWISEHRSHEREHVDRWLVDRSALLLHDADSDTRLTCSPTQHEARVG